MQRTIIEAVKKVIENDPDLVLKISEFVTADLLPDKQKLIFNRLSNTPQRVGEISKKTGIQSRNVATQLNQMQEKCLFISYVKKGKNKLWYINSPHY